MKKNVSFLQFIATIEKITMTSTITSGMKMSKVYTKGTHVKGSSARYTHTFPGYTHTFTAIIKKTTLAESRHDFWKFFKFVADC